MPLNNDPGGVKGPLINAIALIISALIGAGATVFGVFTTGHLTTPNDTREHQKTKQENARLLQENDGLKEENAGLRQENTGLKRQNASLREEIAQSSTSATAQPQKSSAAESKTETEVDNFMFQLDGCKRSAGGLTCVMRVTNTKQDRAVIIYSNSTSIVDSKGNEQKAKVVKIGASTMPTAAETTLPTNVPIKATLNFGDVDSDVNRLFILVVGMQYLVSNGAPENERVQFRDIPLH